MSDTLKWGGDGKCPRCFSYCKVDWFNSTVEWKCPDCNCGLDSDSTIEMCANYKPEKNTLTAAETSDKRNGNLHYFSNTSMSGLFDNLRHFQCDYGKRLHSTSISKDGDMFCCIALTQQPIDVTIVGDNGTRAEVRYGKLNVRAEDLESGLTSTSPVSTQGTLRVHIVGSDVDFSGAFN